jgi:hypothetical protein
MIALIPETSPGSVPGSRSGNDVTSIAALWSKSGWHLERLVTGWTCVIEPCNTIAFVALRTAKGKKSVCLKHFEEIGSQAGIRAPRVKASA